MTSITSLQAEIKTVRQQLYQAQKTIADLRSQLQAAEAAAHSASAHLQAVLSENEQLLRTIKQRRTTVKSEETETND
jgi:chromosome segregation ATPase